MPDPLVSAALAEAYATAPANTVIRETLEVWHPAFDAPLRICADAVIDARLEAAAPRQGGQVVGFVFFPFRLRAPEVSTDGPGIMEVEIADVSRHIVGYFERSVASLVPVEVIWREYVSGSELTGPGRVYGGLTVRGATITPEAVTVQCGWRDLLTERFPRLVYTRESFPTLGWSP